jgi:hypothetical protein
MTWLIHELYTHMLLTIHIAYTHTIHEQCMYTVLTVYMAYT